MQLATWLTATSQGVTEAQSVLAQRLSAVNKGNWRSATIRTEKQRLKRQLRDEPCPEKALIPPQQGRLSAAMERRHRKQLHSWNRRQVRWGAKIQALSSLYGEGIVPLSSPVLDVGRLRDVSSDSFQRILSYIKDNRVLPMFARAVTLALHEVVLAGQRAGEAEHPPSQGDSLHAFHCLRRFALEARLELLGAVDLPLLLLTQSSMEAESN
jgi:hypothetical protein